MAGRNDSLRPATFVLVRPTVLVARLVLASLRMFAFGVALTAASLFARVGALVLFRAADDLRWRFGQWVMLRSFQTFRAIFGLRLHVEGAMPPPGALIAANHRSYLDIVAVASLTRTFFLAKHEVSRWPLLGPGAHALGVPFVKRGEKSSRRSAAASVVTRLQRGFTVCNFPEGTTNDTPLPGPFRPGLFHAVAGKPLEVVPTTLVFGDGGADWVGDATFLDHVFRIAMRGHTDVDVHFGEPVNAAAHLDGDALRDLVWERVAHPIADAVERDDRSWLRRPMRRVSVQSIRGGAFELRTYDQPGRWMPLEALHALQAQLRSVAEGAMDEIPSYGVFSEDRAPFCNRIIAVATEAETGMPVGFTAMVYLPFRDEEGETEPVVHLGLTMLRKDRRGLRLQTPLFKAVFPPAFLNQLRLRYTVTNIAASPAGIGATSDYFQGMYPSYHGGTPCRPKQRAVAQQILADHRHEFGCSATARFDLETFVVRGSNDPSGGGAHQFIKEDPVSRYRVEACNTFCREMLNYPEGDELFQVGEVNLIKSLWRSRSAKRGVAKEKRAA